MCTEIYTWDTLGLGLFDESIKIPNCFIIDTTKGFYAVADLYSGKSDFSDAVDGVIFATLDSTIALLTQVPFPSSLPARYT